MNEQDCSLEHDTKKNKEKCKHGFEPKDKCGFCVAEDIYGRPFNVHIDDDNRKRKAKKLLKKQNKAKKSSVNNE